MCCPWPHPCREAELEALREAAKRERKAKRRKGAAAFIDDGD
jgi:hypothetical protein